MNPFVCPDAIYLAACPVDMRCGIERLGAMVRADFGRDAEDGALYGFVSRDCRKMKLLRFRDGAWCLYYVKLSRGAIRWYRAEDGRTLIQVRPSSLIMLLSGLGM